MEIKNTAKGNLEEKSPNPEYHFDNLVSHESIWDTILP